MVLSCFVLHFLLLQLPLVLFLCPSQPLLQQLLILDALCFVSLKVSQILLHFADLTLMFDSKIFSFSFQLFHPLIQSLGGNLLILVLAYAQVIACFTQELTCSLSHQHFIARVFWTSILVLDLSKVILDLVKTLVLSLLNASTN